MQGCDRRNMQKAQDWNRDYQCSIRPCAYDCGLSENIQRRQIDANSERAVRIYFVQNLPGLEKKISKRKFLERGIFLLFNRREFRRGFWICEESGFASFNFSLKTKGRPAFAEGKSCPKGNPLGRGGCHSILLYIL